VLLIPSFVKKGYEEMKQLKKVGVRRNEGAGSPSEGIESGKNVVRQISINS
jgi:hypothetical protein